MRLREHSIADDRRPPAFYLALGFMEVGVIVFRDQILFRDYLGPAAIPWLAVAVAAASLAAASYISALTIISRSSKVDVGLLMCAVCVDGVVFLAACCVVLSLVS